MQVVFSDTFPVDTACNAFDRFIIGCSTFATCGECNLKNINTGYNLILVTLRMPRKICIIIKLLSHDCMISQVLFNQIEFRFK